MVSGFRLRVLGSGFEDKSLEVYGSGFRAQDSGFRVEGVGCGWRAEGYRCTRNERPTPGSGSWVSDLFFVWGVWGVRCSVWGVWCVVYGAGCRVQRVGCRDWGSGFRV